MEVVVVDSEGWGAELWVEGGGWMSGAWVGSEVRADSNSLHEYQHQETGAVAVLGLTCFLDFLGFFLGSSFRAARVLRAAVLPNIHCCPRAVGMTWVARVDSRWLTAGSEYR